MAENPRDPALLAQANQEMMMLKGFINRAVNGCIDLWQHEPDMDDLETLLSLTSVIPNSELVRPDDLATLGTMAIIMLANERLP